MFRVLDSSQILLKTSPNTFYYEIKIHKSVVHQSIRIIFANLIFNSSKCPVKSSVFNLNNSTNKSEHILF